MAKVKPKKSTGYTVKACLALVLLAALYAVLQIYFRLFDEPLAYLQRYLKTANGVLFGNMVLGISAGTIIFIALLLLLPVLMKNVNTRSYFRNLYQGLITSFIFYISQLIYSYLEKTSRLYLLLSILAVIVATLILIRIMAKMYKKKEDQIEFQTSNLASITAGLIFGIMLQLILLGVGLVKANFKFPF